MSSMMHIMGAGRHGHVAGHRHGHVHLRRLCTLASYLCVCVCVCVCACVRLFWLRATGR